MSPSTDSHRSRDYCLIYIRWSIDSFGDENIRSWDDVAVGSKASTLHSEKWTVLHPTG